MKRLTTTLGILILALGACSGGRPAWAAPQCGNGHGALYCVDAAEGTYYFRFADGNTIQGQCDSGAKWSTGMPFVFANSIHTRMCGSGLNYVR